MKFINKETWIEFDDTMFFVNEFTDWNSNSFYNMIQEIQKEYIIIL